MIRIRNVNMGWSTMRNTTGGATGATIDTRPGQSDRYGLHCIVIADFAGTSWKAFSLDWPGTRGSVVGFGVSSGKSRKCSNPLDLSDERITPASCVVISALNVVCISLNIRLHVESITLPVEALGQLLLLSISSNPYTYEGGWISTQPHRPKAPRSQEKYTSV